MAYKRDMDPALREPTVSWEEMGVNLTIAQMYNYKLWYLVKKNRIFEGTKQVHLT